MHASQKESMLLSEIEEIIFGAHAAEGQCPTGELQTLCLTFGPYLSFTTLPISAVRLCTMSIDL